MSVDEWSVGQRIARHRMRRGLTQEELAGLVGISLSMMKRIESGDRLVTCFSQLVIFAQALRIKNLRDLTGVSLLLMPNGHPGHPAAETVAGALLNRGAVAEAPVDLDDLARRLDRAWQTWQSPSLFRYNAVGRQLPTLIGSAQAATRTAEGLERQQAFRLGSDEADTRRRHAPSTRGGRST